MSKAITLAATLTTAMTLLGLAAGGAAAEPLKVVASFSILGDMAANVGGDRIELTTLVGPNGDAHVYEPRPADAALLSKADVVLVNGLHFEGFLQRLVDASSTKATVVELARGVQTMDAHEDEEEGHAHAGHEEEGHGHAAEAPDDDAHEGHAHKDHAHEGHGHHHGDTDPHAFQSIVNARIYVKNIADAFCVADAAGCDTYRANAAAYDTRLVEAETELKAEIAAIPEDRRVIITSHDAFGYFEKAYGITFVAPKGISTDAEASAADVARLVEQVREEKASAIFVENITNPRLAEQIARETGMTVGGTLFSDALSDGDGPAGTYIDLMLYNARTIKGAILGS
jgi:zinc/manganese transport system substrate-binding protein